MENKVGLLAKKASCGDEDAFKELYKLKYDDIFFLAYKMLGNHHDAEDIAHDVVVKIFERIDQFENFSSFDSYVYSMVRNKSIDYLRKKSNHKENIGLNDNGTESEVVEDNKDLLPHKKLEESDFADYIADIVRKMSPERQRCFNLFFGEDLKYKEIAEVLDISIGTVSSHIKRIKDTIKMEMKKNSDYEIYFEGEGDEHGQER